MEENAFASNQFVILILPNCDIILKYMQYKIYIYLEEKRSDVLKHLNLDSKLTEWASQVTALYYMYNHFLFLTLLNQF